MKTKRRYASIDFLRGIAIFLMYILHIINNLLDFDLFFHEDTIAGAPLGVLVILIECGIIGGLAGLFLMTSAMSHMISMYRHLESGKSLGNLAVKQILRGLVLLLFAFVMEGLLGNYGVLGQIFQHLDDFSVVRLDTWRFRFVHMETIHTIAWCMILNGAIQALLSIKGNWRNHTRMIVIYAVLAVVVLACTPLIWQWIDSFIPGFPFARRIITDINGGNYNLPVVRPYIGYDSFLYVFRSIFLSTLAGTPEPIFPYLAASFIGSILAIYISKPKKSKNFTLRGIKIFIGIGMGMFLIGTIGTLTNFYSLYVSDGFEIVYELFIKFSDHRLYTTIGTEFWYIHHGGTVGPPFAGWLFQFIGLNGLSITIIMGLFRLVEFRGVGKKFAKNSRFIRRFGFIAFTMYTMQWIYFIMYFLTTKFLIPAVTTVSIEPYGKLNWGWTLIVLSMTLLFFMGMNFLWEKIGYIGSLEWCMAIIGLVLVPGSIKEYRENRESGELNTPWWNPLNIQHTFYKAQWISIVDSENQDISTWSRKNKTESKLALRVSIVGLILLPFSIVALFIGFKSQKVEEKNRRNVTAIIVSCIGIVLGIFTYVTLFTVNLGTIGLGELLA